MYPNGLVYGPIIRNERNWEINVFFRGAGKSYMGRPTVRVMQGFVSHINAQKALTADENE